MIDDTLELPFFTEAARSRAQINLADELAGFSDFGQTSCQVVTRTHTFSGCPVEVPAFVNEFWTAKQRAASPAILILADSRRLVSTL